MEEVADKSVIRSSGSKLNYQNMSMTPETICRTLTLTYLERKDLLNSRLVCRSWNEECVSILRKSPQAFLALRDENIAEFLEFAANAKLHLILPFHIRIKDQVSNILENIPKFLYTFGPECVRGLTMESCEFDGPENFAQLSQILAKVSTGLHSLDISPIASGSRILSFDPRQYSDDLSPIDYSFPNLEVLISAVEYPMSFWRRSPLNQFVLDSSSPKLNSLSIPQLTSEASWKTPYTQLKTLAIQTVNFGTRPNALLREMCSGPSPAILQRLSIEEITCGGRLGENDNYSYFKDFLSCFAGGLTSLQIPVYVLAQGISMQTEDELFTLPHLPRLKHLACIKPKFSPGPCFCLFFQPIQANFVPEVLPALTSVRIPLLFLPVQSIIVPGAAESGRSTAKCIRSGVRFMCVKKLELDVTVDIGAYRSLREDYQWKSGEEKDYKMITMASIVENLLEMFPCIQGLMLHLGSDFYNPTLKLVLKEVLLSPLSGGIRELGLEVRGRRDCFGEVLQEIQRPPKILLENFIVSEDDKGFEERIKSFFKEYSTGFSSGVLLTREDNKIVLAAAPTHKPKRVYMTGLEKLKYFPPRGNDAIKNYDFEKFDSVPDAKAFRPDLSLFSKYLPAVREVGIPFQLLGDDSSRIEVLQRLRKEYPSLNINFIYNPQSFYQD